MHKVFAFSTYRTVSGLRIGGFEKNSAQAVVEAQVVYSDSWQREKWTMRITAHPAELVMIEV